MLDWNDVKVALGKKAIECVPRTGRIGLGSGSTAECFIRALAQYAVDEKISIVCLATSTQSEKLALSLGLNILPFDEWNNETLDLLVDGADSVDSQGNMVKGRGAAFVREKLVAYAAKRYVILIDERKKNTQLTGQIPVEILPFGVSHTVHRIHYLGFRGELRVGVSGAPIVTDNGNFIYDTETFSSLPNPEAIHSSLKSVSGVVDTGLFLNFHPDLITGYADGRMMYERNQI